MAETAVSIVIEHVLPLLVQEVRLQKGFQSKVTSIKGQLEIIQSFLKDADIRAEKEDVSNVVKAWVKQVREEAYQIEDVIDEYILHFAKQPFGKKQCFHFHQNFFQFAKKLKARYVIAYKIQDISNSLKEKREMAVSYHFNTIEQGGPSNNARSVTWHDPRMAALFIEEAEVVGIESHRNRLINWLVEGPLNRMVISTVGIGGVGKTTLIKKVYENDKVATHFDCHAWITVSQSYKTEELLRNMIKQFYKARKESIPVEIDAMEQTTLMEHLRLYLHEHRYVVVFDDLWEKGFWDCIELALPKNEKGSRILITSRNEDIAPSDYLYKQPVLPLEKAWVLFCKKVFQHEGGHCPLGLFELSHAVVQRCEGLPLAIVAIGGLLSTKDKVLNEWLKFHNSLSSELKSNPHLKNIAKILSLSYHDLSYNLKACLLYFGMFPEDYYINCARLIRLWNAEGFVKEMQGITLEEVAQGYLNQLIHRSLVPVEQVDFIGKTRSCRIHDMMLEVILSRSKELDFHLASMQNYLNFNRIARRLSIQNNVKTSLQSATSYETRSILILGVDEVPNSFLSTCFANFKLMKIMDCEGAPIDYIPKEVGNLFHLRYLSLRDTKVQILPKSIGKLHNLETLDLKRSLVSELPVEISGLRKLRYLAAYNHNRATNFNIDSYCGVKIPNGIGLLKSLQKLFQIEATSSTLITELGSLSQLKKLTICKLKKENGIDLCTVIQKMSHLQTLEILATSEEEVLNLQSLPSRPPLLQTLSLHGRLEKLPKWIPKLKSIVQIVLFWSKLMEDPLKVLQSLPNLMSLSLRDGYEGEQLHIEGRSFQKLKELRFQKLGGLNRLIIDEGALPFLEFLEIGECPQLKEVPSSIHHLKSLKKLKFTEMPTEFVLSLQPDEGPDFGKVEHIPCVEFWYRTHGDYYISYQLGNSAFLKRLRN
ncbi:disease resistance protein RPM1-like [Quercus lobata]|uniref:disease resistance protein RPM1-like n=1 Tax=Quercus lobata TaxID=97700 RepID=UPI00124528A2|nr:disease resistance protein RPM1-like [Quercus lobata]